MANSVFAFSSKKEDKKMVLLFMKLLQKKNDSKRVDFGEVICTYI